jgi:hypothetical protein
VVFKGIISWDKYKPDAEAWLLGLDWVTLVPDEGAAVLEMRLAGSNTDNSVPTIAPIPTPTINKRSVYSMVLAIGFNWVLRDGRLFIFGFPCFWTRTVLTFPNACCGILALGLGIGLTATGITILEGGLCPPAGKAGLLI